MDADTASMIRAWCRQHDLLHPFSASLENKEVVYPPDLEQLSDDDLDALSQGCRLGEIVRFKRLVMEITARTQLKARQAAGTSSSTTMPSTETATKAAPKVIYEDTDPVQGGETDTDPEVAVVNRIFPNPKEAVGAAVRIEPQGPAGPTTRREAYEARQEAYEAGREASDVVSGAAAAANISGPTTRQEDGEGGSTGGGTIRREEDVN